MRAKIDARLRLGRLQVSGYGMGDDRNGAFQVKGPMGRKLNVIVSDGAGWEHASVSVAGKSESPTWFEMCWVKDLVWEKEEGVVQYHPPQSAYVNWHPGCLHLWRQAGVEPLLPPTEMV